MKALILNSGIGKRMGDLTQNKPKCLVEIAEEETILSRQLKALLSQGISDIIITTGPFEEQIKQQVQKTFPDLQVRYVNNPLYETTNYIYSMLLAKEHMDNDLILMHGDLVFTEELLHKTIHSPHPSTALVNPDVQLPEKDFKARLKDGLVTEISIHIFGTDCAFLNPLYKISKELCSAWIVQMELFEQEGRLSVYAEDALNLILSTQALHPVYFKNEELCTEIDDLSDLDRVRQALTS
jgi:phosphoenolpyruvate phosphomutase